MAAVRAPAAGVSGDVDASRSAQASEGDRGDRSRSKTVGHYLLGPTLGEGTFGKVKLGTHVLTGEKVAIKLLEKSKIKEVADVERVSREINILKRIRHRNVIQLFEVIDTPKQIFLVMEYSDGGELFDYIVKHKRVPEPQAAAFMHDICNGLDYLHSVNVVHRDLKPENLLMHRGSNGWVIKVIDFGLSNTCDGGRLLKTACGSPCYAAPEMIAGHKYVGSLTDMWSLGVVLFALVCGYLPFEHENTAKLYQKILNGDYTTPDFVSSQVKDLIRRILETNPRKRYTMEDIRRHPWFRQATPSTSLPIRLIPSSYGEISGPVMKQIARLGLDVRHVADSVIRNAHNHASTTYYLLAERLMREGIPLFDKVDNMSWVPEGALNGLTSPPGGDERHSASASASGALVPSSSKPVSRFDGDVGSAVPSHHGSASSTEESNPSGSARPSSGLVPGVGELSPREIIAQHQQQQYQQHRRSARSRSPRPSRAGDEELKQDIMAVYAPAMMHRERPVTSAFQKSASPRVKLTGHDSTDGSSIPLSSAVSQQQQQQQHAPAFVTRPAGEGTVPPFAAYYAHPGSAHVRGRVSVHEAVPSRSPRVHSSLSRPVRERNRRVSSVSPRGVPPRASSVASSDRGVVKPAAVPDASIPSSDTKAQRAALIYSSYRPTSSYWPPQPGSGTGSGTGTGAARPGGPVVVPTRSSRAPTPSRKEDMVQGATRPTPPSSPKFGPTSAASSQTATPAPPSASASSSRPVSTYGVRLGPLSSSDTGGTGSVVKTHRGSSAAPAVPPDLHLSEGAVQESSSGAVAPHPPQLFMPRAPDGEQQQTPSAPGSKDSSDATRPQKMWGGRRIKEVAGPQVMAPANVVEADNTVLEDVMDSPTPGSRVPKVPSRPLGEASKSGRSGRFSFTVASSTGNSASAVGPTAPGPASGYSSSQPFAAAPGSAGSRSFGFGHRVVPDGSQQQRPVVVQAVVNSKPASASAKDTEIRVAAVA